MLLLCDCIKENITRQLYLSLNTSTQKGRDVRSQFFEPQLNQLHSVLLDDTATLQRPLSS